MDKIVIWGASGHAMVVADILRLRAEYLLEGFLDSVHPERHHTSFYGAKILGGEEQLEEVQEKGVKHLIIAIGHCEARLRCAELARSKGFQFASAIHPSAAIASNVVIGSGTVIAAGAVINPGSRIGEHVIINTSSSIDHECIIGDGAHISPGVHLAGNITVGRGTWIGIGACVIERISIGSGSLIGAGSVVVKDVPDDVVAYGNPARVKDNTNLGL